MKPTTQLIHVADGVNAAAAPLTTPIYETATYLFENAQEVRDYNEGKSEKFLYSRYANPTVVAVEKKIAALDLRRPMRFTGQVFFDASHRPCVNGKPVESSRRVSAWEIHPVYAIDVCINTSLSGCPRTDASKWMPLHEWLAEEDDQ